VAKRILLLLCLVFVVACGALPFPQERKAGLGVDPVRLPPLQFTFQRAGHGLYDLPDHRLPYREAVPRRDAGLRDRHGVRMYRDRGRLVDHPVAQAAYGLANAEKYRASRDEFYLRRAEDQARRLLDRATEHRGAWYLPYPFDFSLHGMAHERLRAPWYSAMAQGQALSLFVRLHELTRDPTYRRAADGVFASFLQPGPRLVPGRVAGAGLPPAAAPWVVFVDGRGYLWLEEYASRRPDRTFNGHIFAAWGLWDYWRMTRDGRAAQLWDGALTTLRAYYPTMRRPGGPSRYCVSHPVYDAKYHEVHVVQMRMLAAMTRNTVFARFAAQLAADHRVNHTANQAAGQPGDRTAVARRARVAGGPGPRDR
jgi:hypothetical protein